MSTYRFYLFSFTSKVGPNDNMAPPSRAKGGAMAPVAPSPAAASGRVGGIGALNLPREDFYRTPHLTSAFSGRDWLVEPVSGLRFHVVDWCIVYPEPR